jgi:hypothetical protein
MTSTERRWPGSAGERRLIAAGLFALIAVWTGSLSAKEDAPRVIPPQPVVLQPTAPLPPPPAAVAPETAPAAKKPALTSPDVKKRGAKKHPPAVKRPSPQKPASKPKRR